MDYARRSTAEASKTVRKLTLTVTEQQELREEEVRQRVEAQEHANAAEKRVTSLVSELEEARMALAQAERQQKVCEGELHEAGNQMAELAASSESLAAAKRKMESDLTVAQAELEEAQAEAKALREEVRRSQADMVRLGEEMRHSEEQTVAVDKQRRFLELQCKEWQERLDQAETVAVRSTKKVS